MGIRFSIPEFLLIVMIALALPASAKKDRERNGTVNDDDTTVVRNSTISKAGKPCGHYVYTCNAHS